MVLLVSFEDRRFISNLKEIISLPYLFNCFAICLSELSLDVD